jgi:non-ribosomal peptide synthetase component F
MVVEANGCFAHQLMTIPELLSHLRGLDVKLWVEGDRLRFSAPDGVMTPALRAELGARKAELLPVLRQARVAARESAPAIQPIARTENLALSFAQQRQWTWFQLAPDSVLYHISEAARFYGPLDPRVLEQVINEIIQRHETLRTTFSMVDGEPVQVIAPRLTLPLSVTDLSQLPEAEAEAEARRLVVRQARQVFDLSRGPLVRVSLLRLGDEQHVVHFTMHHIVSDGWSMGVLVREVVSLYAAFAQGAPSPLPPLPLQYADFAHWQRQWLSGERLEALLDYWKRTLGGAPATMELPTDRPRPPIQSARGAHQVVALDRAASDALRELARQEGATLFMTCLAAFKTLLYRYTGREDILVGTPIAGRTRAELEGLIGFFANTLVLRTDLGGEPGFRQVLRRVRETVLGADAHQELPFERLVDELAPARDPGRIPWVQAAFMFQASSLAPGAATLELPGMRVGPLKIESETAKTDLILSLTDRPDGISGSFDYNTDLFDPGTIARMAADFQTLVAALAAAPDEPIANLAPEPGQVLAPVRNDEFELPYAGSNLTRNQLLMWTGQKLHPGVPFYNVVFTFHIAGAIDPARFQQAFQLLVNSSDAMRTVIGDVDGVPQQRVLPSFPYTVECLDFSGDPAQVAAIRAWAIERAQLSFDPATCLFDTALVKLAEREFVWYFNQHHIIGDRQSTQTIFQHVSSFYEQALKDELKDQVVALPAFQDYLDYELRYRNSLRHLRSKAWWEKKLADEPDPPAFYGKVPHKQGTRVERIVCDLGLARTEQLTALAYHETVFAKNKNVTMFNLFSAVLCAWLYHIGGNRRFSIGAASHNRRSSAFTDTIGIFMEVHPLFLEVEEADTFVSLAKKTADEAWQTLQHSECIMGKKAYDVFLNYHTRPFPPFAGAPVETERLHPGHESDSLAVNVQDLSPDGSLRMYFDFHCEAFDESQRTQAIQSFLRILDAMLENPAQPVERIALLSADETQRALAGFNHREQLFPDDRIVTRLFESQVEKTPLKTAAVYNGASRTFQDLNVRANQLANLIGKLKSR